MDCEIDSLVGRAKPTHASNTKKGIESPLPMARQVFSHLQERSAPLHVVVIQEVKCHRSKFSCLLHSAFIAKHDTIGYGIPFWSAGVSSPCWVPSPLLMYPQPLHYRDVMRSGKCFNSASAVLVSIVLTLSVKHSLIPATVKKISFIPVKTRTNPHPETIVYTSCSDTTLSKTISTQI